ncbi:hypothetical protein EGW08_004578, partial [Elysia chlorotica]
RHLLENDVEACRAVTCDIPYPRTYVIYKLRGNDVIDLDGRLEDKAWKDVAWSDSFIDIQGRDFPEPRLKTKVKMRYDYRFLYIGALLEEPDVWANVTLHDGPGAWPLWIFYKEITINARGIVADLMMTKPYVDSGEPLQFWESDLVSEVYVQGSLNNPRNEYWTIEMAVPFSTLYQGSGASMNRSSPIHDETWRANFLRCAKIKRMKRFLLFQSKISANWWVWQSPQVTNVHLPDRWGLIQFQDAKINSSRFMTSEKWVATNALLDTYSALQAFHAVTGRYTDRKELLHLPPYVFSGKCVDDVNIKLDWSGFHVTVKPKGGNLEEGHIKADHFLWFGKEDMQYF